MRKIHLVSLASNILEINFVKGKDVENIEVITKKNTYISSKAINIGYILNNMQVRTNLYVAYGQCDYSFEGLNTEFRNVRLYPTTKRTKRNKVFIFPNNKCITRWDIDGYNSISLNANKIKNDVINNVKEEDIVVLAGRIGPTMDIEWYKDFIIELNKKKVLVFLDTSGKGMLESVNASPFYIKPNEDEIKELIGEYKISDLPKRAKEIAIENSIENVNITIGEKGVVSYNLSSDKCLLIKPTTEINKPYSTIGCGDSFNSGFIWGFINNKNFEECVKLGVSFGTANVIDGFPSKITIETVKKCYDNLIIEEIIV